MTDYVALVLDLASINLVRLPITSYQIFLGIVGQMSLVFMLRILCKEGFCATKCSGVTTDYLLVIYIHSRGTCIVNRLFGRTRFTS